MNKTTHFNTEPRDDCGKLNKTHVSKQVSLYGWAHRRRDHGGVIFVDLRDTTGVVQIVCNPDTQQSFTLAETIRAEYVLQVVGTVRDRPEGTTNPDMPTGDIEVVVVSLNILATSRALPFGIDEYQQVSEDVRLRYRYLDLRRSSMHHNLIARAKTVSCVRNYLEKQGFIDIETPTLTRATPEGARDYLAPSRTHPGAFFALPQSPQLFKQLLMVAGFERYYQIVKCYRDEDLRADRQPEFTQIDIEASFTSEQAIMALTETMLREIFANANIALSEFPQMTYADAMRLYGSDKPDLRIACQLIDVADICQDVDFAVFNKPAQDPHSRIAMLCVPGISLSRKDIDDLTKYVAQFGAKGLAYIQVRDPHDLEHGLQSPIIKFLPHQVRKQFIHRANAKAGDILFFGADKTNIVNDAMGALRVHLGHKLSLVEKGFRPVWVTDFPMFERDKSHALAPLHHPFTAPSCSLEEFIESPHTANSRAYDVVLNGVELGGGSIRIHDYHTQLAVLAALGIDSEQAQEKFGFLLDALQYGCPPHGGIALGLDRIVMMMVGVTSIRDVIAFPKTQSAACPLTGAPTPIETQTLAELGVQSIGNVVAG